MKFQIQISKPWLKIISAMFVNLSAGLFLLAFGISDIWILFIDMGSATLLMLLAKFTEEVLEQL